MKMLQTIRNWITRMARPSVAHTRTGTPALGLYNALGDYITEAPSPQHALDLFKNEWSCALPPPYDTCVAGAVPAFVDDSRVLWGEEALGGFTGAKILELGPLEGAHSYMMEHRGAASVKAIESNGRAFLRCLIVKELLDLKRVRFEFGDFMAYLKTSTDRYDLIFASGVLYHMSHPLVLLKEAADHADRLFVWTHYYDESVIAALPAIAANFKGLQPMSHAGFSCQGHLRQYGESLRWSGFCGGSEKHSVWMEKEDIIAALKAYGFTRVTTGHDTPDHHSGPAFCLVASK